MFSLILKISTNIKQIIKLNKLIAFKTPNIKLNAIAIGGIYKALIDLLPFSLYEENNCFFVNTNSFFNPSLDLAYTHLHKIFQFFDMQLILKL